MSEAPERDALEAMNMLDDVPADIRQAARLAPDHWFGMVDPGWRGEGTPPQWAVVGEWRSDVDGEIAEWQANEDYRPSPVALGWPEPTDGIDEAVQQAVTGYGPGDDVIRLLAPAEVRVLLGPDDQPLAARTADGSPVIPVFTSEAQVRAVGALGSRSVGVVDLVGELPPEHQLYVNPTGVVSMVIETQQLKAAIATKPADTPPSD
ncbi:type VII secretion system-associated protein [Streptomyces sp. NBC_01341]|uniref:type VII secretion system-associated protein n=1 Tax=Streptomyces sp. NBC_01341 TaxID=2903831 RepID=UPI002E113555|nr:type VII secretion system-associated protein [Streptomyces sp. NBC_01341]